MLTKNLPEHDLPQEAIGTIVEVLQEDAFLVECADKRGVTYAMADLPANLLMEVVQEPLAEAA
ncbi:MAG: DUF4926 domain-containing protein [Saprospiraceae bacterium]